MRAFKIKYDKDAPKYTDIHDDGRFTNIELNEQLKQRARYVVAGNAHDTDDCRLLMDILGLLPIHDVESYEHDSQGTSQTI